MSTPEQVIEDLKKKSNQGTQATIANGGVQQPGVSTMPTADATGNPSNAQKQAVAPGYGPWNAIKDAANIAWNATKIPLWTVPEDITGTIGNFIARGAKSAIEGITDTTIPGSVPSVPTYTQDAIGNIGDSIKNFAVGALGAKPNAPVPAVAQVPTAAVTQPSAGVIDNSRQTGLVKIVQPQTPIPTASRMTDAELADWKAARDESNARSDAAQENLDWTLTKKNLREGAHGTDAGRRVEEQISNMGLARANAYAARTGADASAAKVGAAAQNNALEAEKLKSEIYKNVVEAKTKLDPSKPFDYETAQKANLAAVKGNAPLANMMTTWDQRLHGGSGQRADLKTTLRDPETGKDTTMHFYGVSADKTQAKAVQTLLNGIQSTYKQYKDAGFFDGTEKRAYDKTYAANKAALEQLGVISIPDADKYL